MSHLKETITVIFESNPEFIFYCLSRLLHYFKEQCYFVAPLLSKARIAPGSNCSLAFAMIV